MLTTHLSMRVAWHDHSWDGTVCGAPCDNSFCVALDRVREARDEEAEARIAGKSWPDLPADHLPPCARQSGGFMSPLDWTCTITHPYADIAKSAATHGHLLPTPVLVPAFSSFAVPYWWMLRSTQDKVQDKTPEPLPPDEVAPFDSAWIFSSERQQAILRMFFERLRDGSSLVMYYTKEGQPIDDDIGRLVVGVGTITRVHPMISLKASRQPTYPAWDRLVSHSIRPGGHDGVLLPYHAYLEPTADPDEDARRRTLLREIAVVPESSLTREFSYAAEVVDADVTLSILKRTLDAVRAVREHGIAPGPWLEREEWVNAQIAKTWEDRGPHPGLGACLEALGMRCGTSLMLDLADAGRLEVGRDPWIVVDAILRGREEPPKSAYAHDLASVAVTWEGLPDERRRLLQLLSRFSLSRVQAVRWFDPQARLLATRGGPISDAEVLSNPYLIAETDLGDEQEQAVGVAVVDRGVLPDDVIAVAHPVPEPSAVKSPLDERRVRAALVSILRDAASDGDSLLSLDEAMHWLGELSLSRGCEVPIDWVLARKGQLEGTIEVLELPGPTDDGSVRFALQLSEYARREADLHKIMVARVDREIPAIDDDWRELLVEAITGLKERRDQLSPRENDALAEQEKALRRVTTRKLSVLAGRAGTGKTSVVGALLRCTEIVMGGVLLLAPTGKARVRLARVTGAEDAKTVAQFLNGLNRYDGAHQRVRFMGDKYAGAKTVVIDECSMLTLDDLAAVLAALDMTTVDRIILVGDPSQLPPIGVGRPFADLVGFLEQAAASDDEKARHGAGALGLLTVEVRSVADQQSDALRLAAWFSRDSLRVDADSVLAELERGEPLNDLEVRFWDSPEDLKRVILKCFETHLGMTGPDDVPGFNAALGIEGPLVPLADPDRAEAFQVLTPVRMHPWGVYELNRWVQARYRGYLLEEGRKWHSTLGAEEIVRLDKVIQLENQWRNGYNHATKQKTKLYLANGEIGLVMKTDKDWYAVALAGRPNLTASYSRRRDFAGGTGPLELAYALTVHKAQGSEFETVFVVIPEKCRLISRELLYTALTRSRKQLVLLVQGKDLGFLHEMSSADRSETARRNTRLFATVVRESADVVPFADYLIHRTLKGHMVRSKSELVIANVLFDLGLEYDYEQRLPLSDGRGAVLPDFSFATPAGDRIVWEHLGMLNKADYRAGWEKKLKRYQASGFTLGDSLFTTEDDAGGGLDSQFVRQTAEQIKGLV